VQGASVPCLFHSVADTLETLAALLEICLVHLASVEVEAHSVGGYAAALASEVAVKYLVALLGEVLKEELVKGYGLLAGVDARLFGVALRCCLEYLGVCWEARPRILAHSH